MKSTSLRIFLLAASLLPTARADQILALASESDVVILGESSAAPSTKADTVELAIRADFVLKGAVSIGSLVSAVFPERKGDVISGIAPTLPPAPGTYGLWFLKKLDGAYSGIPLDGQEGLTHYTKRVVVELPKFWVPPSGVSVEQLLLEAALEAYQYQHNDSNERLLIQSLQYARLVGYQDLAVKFVDSLLDSPSPEERNIGMLIGVRMSHDPAMARLEGLLESVGLDQRTMGHILHALENYYNPNSLEGVARVESLLLKNRTMQVAGLDLALGKSLRKINDRQMLPLAALLLDSSDPEAVRRGAHHFYVYSVLAKKDGSISKDGKGGSHPFHNEETKAHTGLDEAMSAAENAEFWRKWWANNQAGIATRAASGR